MASRQLGALRQRHPCRATRSGKLQLGLVSGFRCRGLNRRNAGAGARLWSGRTSCAGSTEQGAHCPTKPLRSLLVDGNSGIPLGRARFVVRRCLGRIVTSCTTADDRTGGHLQQQISILTLNFNTSFVGNLTSVATLEYFTLTVFFLRLC